MVIDDDGGALNHTAAAAIQNAKNIALTRSAEVAGWYLADWAMRRVGF